MLPELKKQQDDEKREQQYSMARAERQYTHLKNQELIKGIITRLNHDKLKEQMWESELKRKQDWIKKYDETPIMAKVTQILQSEKKSNHHWSQEDLVQTKGEYEGSPL